MRSTRWIGQRGLMCSSPNCRLWYSCSDANPEGSLCGASALHPEDGMHARSVSYVPGSHCIRWMRDVYVVPPTFARRFRSSRIQLFGLLDTSYGNTGQYRILRI